MWAYIIIFLILLAFEDLYLKIAEHAGITDKPNDRSSHSRAVVRGGGIIIYFGAAIWFVWSGCSDIYLFIGITILAAISFIDDLHEVPVTVRLIVQFLAAAMILWQGNVTPEIFIIWVTAMILGVGLMNSFNFMDGINGSAGLYSLVTLWAMGLLNQSLMFVDMRLIYVSAMACLIFCIYNFRTNARCFAGDVGSIIMGAIVFYCLCRLIMATRNPGWLVLVAVFGADTILTIIRRIFLKQNIFRPHRMHAYQLMSNQLKQPHLLVASGLSLLQVVIDIPVLLTDINKNGYLAMVAAILTVIYLFIVYRSKRS